MLTKMLAKTLAKMLTKCRSPSVKVKDIKKQRQQTNPFHHERGCSRGAILAVAQTSGALFLKLAVRLSPNFGTVTAAKITIQKTLGNEGHSVKFSGTRTKHYTITWRDWPPGQDMPVAKNTGRPVTTMRIMMIVLMTVLMVIWA